MSGPRILYLYHASPAQRRRSIQREGLRRVTWLYGHLVLCAAEPGHSQALAAHVARRHGSTTANMDFWALRIRASDTAKGPGSTILCLTDVPPEDVRGPCSTWLPDPTAFFST